MARADATSAPPSGEQSKPAVESMDMRRATGGQWHRFCRNDEGQDLMEYALLAALISIAAIGTITQVGTTLRDVFWRVIAATVGAV